MHDARVDADLDAADARELGQTDQEAGALDGVAQPRPQEPAVGEALNPAAAGRTDLHARRGLLPQGDHDLLVTVGEAHEGEPSDQKGEADREASPEPERGRGFQGDKQGVQTPEPSGGQQGEPRVAGPLTDPFMQQEPGHELGAQDDEEGHADLHDGDVRVEALAAEETKTSMVGKHHHARREEHVKPDGEEMRRQEAPRAG